MTTRFTWRRTAPATLSLLLAAVLTTVLPTPAHAASPEPGVTVLTLEPLDFGSDKLTGLMNSTLSKFAPTYSTARAPVRVPSNSDLTWQGLLKARDALDTSLQQVPGKKIVFGWSRGAQVASEWLRSYAGKPGKASAADVSFILIGNPQRRLGGSSGATLDGHKLEPTPDTTQYQVTDLSRRWDGWANTDNWPGSPNDAGAKIFLKTVGKWTVHSSYSDVSATSDNMVRGTVGNTTYLVSKR